MDYGGQFEREGRVMSQVHVRGVDLCDNVPNPEALTAHTQNLNQTNTLGQTQRLPSSQNEEGGRCGLIQKSNNGRENEAQQGKEGYKGKGAEEDEEEDVDEDMEEESEGSSCVIRCQSPDTPMTDSSYSETGSLMETPYLSSPGTSPEPTSPVIPVLSPDTVYPISAIELSQSDADVDTDFSNTVFGATTTGSFTCTHGPNITVGPIDSTSRTITSSTWSTSSSGPICTAGSTDRVAKTTNSTTEQVTSSTDPAFICGSTCTTDSASSSAAPTTTTAVTFTLTALTTLNSSECATMEPFTFMAGPATSTESTANSVSSNWEHNITSNPVITCSSVTTCATGPIPKPALLDSLEQLAQKGDDVHLPNYLHQIAEAFVLHEDYQRALWCIQLERLYHQRLLDNLRTLQEQWESQCSRTSSDLATRHLDPLKHICQTHSRPQTRDAEDISLDILKPNFGELPSCSSAHQVEGGMEQRPENSSCPVMPSINLPDRLSFSEISEEAREDPDGFHGSQLTDKPGNDREGAEAEGETGHTISVKENGLHPSTAGGMDQSTPAEQQEDLVPALKREAEEETDIEEAAEALEMEDEGEEEEEERQKERDSPLSQKAVPVETLVSEADLEVQQLHQDVTAQDKLHEETQHCQITQEAHVLQDPDVKQQEQDIQEKGEEEEEYELDQADIIREAHTLDDMAKLITVEMSPASGLVSILKKRSICVDNVSVSTSSRAQPEKPTAKRRVRFKVPDDSYDHEVGGGDSCLLLFLLCLVTVVISIGGTALYCALGDAQSSVCQDFSRNADFYIGQIQRGIAQLQLWFGPGS